MHRPGRLTNGAGYEKIAKNFIRKEVIHMNKKLLCLLLALVLALGCLAGCGEVAGEIAGNVADAAKKELENQIKLTFEKYKVEIIEMKTAAGKLSGSSGDNEFFCAVLVQSDSDAIPQSVADNLSKLFHDAGIMVQTGSQIESAHLEHKDLSYKFSDFGNGNTYYTVFCYIDKIPTLSDLQQMIAAETESVG